MPWIIAGATIGAGLLGSKASKDASGASSAASKQAIEENRRQFQLTRADTEPYRDIGRRSLYELANIFNLPSSTNVGGGTPGMIPYTDEFFAEPYTNKGTSSKGLYGNLEMDPGYEFRLSEGEKAIQRQQSAGGTRYGGAALKAAARYGQDYASNEFSNAVNRRNAELGYLFSLAGFGSQGIATAGQAGAASAGNNSNILMQNAANQGSAAMTGASAINNAVQGGLQNYYTHSLLRDYNRPPTPATSTTSNYGAWA